jgi:hypothetical protein
MSKRQKTGGRRKGTPNRLSMQFRLLLLHALDGEVQRIPEYLQAIPEGRRLELLIKLLPYVLPRLEPMDAEKADRLGLLSTETQIDAFEQLNSLDPFIRRSGL